MSAFDVRDGAENNITSIIIADDHPTVVIATNLTPSESREGVVLINDVSDDYVMINSEEHANNLIKALNKAIELKWFDK
jgi:hypothetical protein